MNVAIKALTTFNKALENPIVRLVGKGFWLGMIAILVYAGRAYLHDAIGSDPVIKDLQTDTVATKALVTAHDVFVKEQSKTDERLSEFFKESRASRDDMTSKLSAILQHGLDQDQRLDRIERKIDK